MIEIALRQMDNQYAVHLVLQSVMYKVHSAYFLSIVRRFHFLQGIIKWVTINSPAALIFEQTIIKKNNIRTYFVTPAEQMLAFCRFVPASHVSFILLLFNASYVRLEFVILVVQYSAVELL
jgi:hypothetical protein